MLTMPVADLRSQLCLCVQNFGIELQKLVVNGQYGIQRKYMQLDNLFQLIKPCLLTNNLHFDTFIIILVAVVQINYFTYDASLYIVEIKGTTTTTTVGDVLVQYLIATRNLQIQLQNVYFPEGGQTTTGFGIQIQTLANGLTTGLESVYLDNEQVRQVLIVQCRELAQQIETIIERLQGQVRSLF